MTIRERFSATVEAELLVAGRAALADGRAGSLSAWVNGALRRQAWSGRCGAMGTVARHSSPACWLASTSGRSTKT